MNSSGMAEKLLVISAEEMSDDEFLIHMNKRHSDSLGGLDFLWFVSEEVTDAWRAFHYRLHALRLGYKHRHEDD